jgi:hypothetical protein
MSLLLVNAVLHIILVCRLDGSCMEMNIKSRVLSCVVELCGTRASLRLHVKTLNLRSTRYADWTDR